MHLTETVVNGVRLLAALSIALLVCGCAYTDKNGRRCHIIIGAGIVRHSTTNETGATILNVKAVGLYTGTGTISLGYVDQTRVEVQTNANVLIELRK